VLAVVALLLADFGASSLVVLAAAGVLLDLAVQSHQVLSQREIYGLRPQARARINTVHMTTIFIGGAVSSAAAGALYDAAGWGGACRFGAGLSAIGLLIWAGSTMRTKREEATAQPAPAERSPTSI
jgi:predicted MFS family arabinose efflux permease